MLGKKYYILRIIFMNYMKYILFILIRNLENNSQRCNDKYSYSFILIAPNLKYKTMLIRGFITNK